MTKNLKKMHRLSTNKLFNGRETCLFLLPACKTFKRYIDETSKLLDAWTDETFEGK